MKVKEANLEYRPIEWCDLPQELRDALDVGIKAMDEGRVVPHEEAMKQIRESLGLDKL